MANRFKHRNWTEETILDKNGKEIGVLKIKPSGILWKPPGKSEKFYKVPLKVFTEWITNPSTKATLIEK